MSVLREKIMAIMKKFGFLIPISILIFSYILYNILLGLMKQTNTSEIPEYMTEKNDRLTLLESGHPYIDGHDWTQIDTLPIKKEDKDLIYYNLIKVCLEASMLGGKPISAKTTNYLTSTSYIKSIYKSERYKDIPLSFILRTKNMYDRGVPKQNIDNYLDQVLRKLQKNGLI